MPKSGASSLFQSAGLTIKVDLHKSTRFLYLGIGNKRTDLLVTFFHQNRTDDLLSRLLTQFERQNPAIQNRNKLLCQTCHIFNRVKAKMVNWKLQSIIFSTSAGV